MTPAQAITWIDVARYGFQAFVLTVVPWVLTLYALALVAYIVKAYRPIEPEQDDAEPDALEELLRDDRYWEMLKTQHKGSGQ